MKLTLFFAVLLCVAISANGRSLVKRKLLGGGGYTCPLYTGPRHSQKDLQIEVTYVSPVPSEEHERTLPVDMNNLPDATLFAVATVHFSEKFDITLEPALFKIYKGTGAILDVALSEDHCVLTVHFYQESSCKDTCLPYGVCIQLDSDYILEKFGYDLPLRKACRAVTPEVQHRCLDMSVSGVSMGTGPKTDLPMAIGNSLTLFYEFNSPLPHGVSLSKDDITVIGPVGSYVKSIDKVGSGPYTIAYKITIVHGSFSSDETIKICFIGAKTINKKGPTFYHSNKNSCVKYMLTKDTPKEMKSSMMIYEAKPRPPTCFPYAG